MLRVEIEIMNETILHLRSTCLFSDQHNQMDTNTMHLWAVCMQKNLNVKFFLTMSTYRNKIAYVTIF